MCSDSIYFSLDETNNETLQISFVYLQELANKTFKEISEAYEVLSNEEKRKIYDDWIDNSQESDESDESDESEIPKIESI